MGVPVATSARMRRVRQSGTEPELAMRKLLTSGGLRFRLHNRDLPGSPDIANRRQRWAVFVHGCFWHSHPGCPRATLPRTNRAYWAAKCRRNVRRDRIAAVGLAAIGYRVLVAWECHINRSGNLSTNAFRFLIGGGERGSIAETQRVGRTGTLGIKRKVI